MTRIPLAVAVLAPCLALCLAGTAQAKRLTLDDQVSRWPRASADDKIDFTNRMGKAFGATSAELDATYFMRCLEETANIGNPTDLKLEEMVKNCVSLKQPDPE